MMSSNIIHSQPKPNYFLNAQSDETKAHDMRKAGESELRRLYKDVFGERSTTSKRAVNEYQQKLLDRVYPNGGELRDYQAEGVAFLLSNYVNQRCSILADEMGTSKTAGAIS